MFGGWKQHLDDAMFHVSNLVFLGELPFPLVRLALMLQSPVEWPTAIAIAIPSPQLPCVAPPRLLLPSTPTSYGRGRRRSCRWQSPISVGAKVAATTDLRGNHGTLQGLGEDFGPFGPSLACENLWNPATAGQLGTHLLSTMIHHRNFHRRRIQKCHAEAKNIAGFNPERTCNSGWKKKHWKLANFWWSLWSYLRPSTWLILDTMPKSTSNRAHQS